MAAILSGLYLLYIKLIHNKVYFGYNIICICYKGTRAWPISMCIIVK